MTNSRKPREFWIEDEVVTTPAGWKFHPAWDRYAEYFHSAGIKLIHVREVLEGEYYPTAHAYEQACKALHKWRECAEELAEALEVIDLCSGEPGKIKKYVNEALAKYREQIK